MESIIQFPKNRIVRSRADRKHELVNPVEVEKPICFKTKSESKVQP